MPELIKIKLGELPAFLESGLFLSLNVRPLPSLRASSYLHNPSGNAGDFVLYLYIEGTELLAFRSLFAGVITTTYSNCGMASFGVVPDNSISHQKPPSETKKGASGDSEFLKGGYDTVRHASGSETAVPTSPDSVSCPEKGILRFGFCSGSWVTPACRGRGYAGMLLREAYNDWNGRLVLTNYSPAGLHSNLNSGLFTPLHQFSGARAYFRFSLAQKFRRESSSLLARLVLGMADFGIVCLGNLKTIFRKPAEFSGYHFELLCRPDEDCLRLAEEQKGCQLFGRGRDALKWIFDFPWVSKDKGDEELLYPFTSYAPDFSMYLVKVYSSGIFRGFFSFSIRNRHLKSLHFYVSLHDFPAVANWLKNYSIQNRMAMVTVYNPEVATFLLKHRYPFLRVKPYGQKIFSTFSLEIPPGIIIQDGDGDYAFT